MVAGLSKATTLYLAPLLALAANLISIFAFLAPVVMFRDKIALLTIIPPTSLIQQRSSDGVDGVSLFLGLLAPALAPRKQQTSIVQLLTYRNFIHRRG